MTGTLDWKLQWGHRTYASPRAILAYPFSLEQSAIRRSFPLNLPGVLGIMIGLQNNLGMTFGWSLQGPTSFPEVCRNWGGKRLHVILEPHCRIQPIYSFTTFCACSPLGPFATSNSIVSPSFRDLKPLP